MTRVFYLLLVLGDCNWIDNPVFISLASFTFSSVEFYGCSLFLQTTELFNLPHRILISFLLCSLSNLSTLGLASIVLSLFLVSILFRKSNNLFLLYPRTDFVFFTFSFTKSYYNYLSSRYPSEGLLSESLDKFYSTIYWKVVNMFFLLV
jgi:hypothetical protein